MRNSEYWEKRALLIENENYKNTMYHVQKMQEQYETAKENIQKEIDKFYKDFAINNQIQLSEAKRILNNNELKEFKTTLRQYKKMIENDVEGKLKDKIINISIKQRITRLQSLQAKIDIILEQLQNNSNIEMNNTFFETLENTYYKNIYELEKDNNIHTDFTLINQKTADSILTYNWSGVTYSDRIWRNQIELRQKLKDSLNKNFIQGNSIGELAAEISKAIDTDYKNCVRLMRTEVNYINNKASIQAYKEKGIKQYIFVAVLDLRTSKICSEMDGEIINIDDLVVGVNCPPLHPNCRSTVIPFIEGLERNRVARNVETGETEEIGNMNYKQWYQKYVENKYNKDEIQTLRKKFLNYSSDKEQYARYREILKTHVDIVKFDKFQEIKYNNKTEWKQIKAEYLESLGIKTTETAKQYINNINKTINMGRQEKHILGSNNYVEGKSYLTISSEEAQELVNKYAGQGQINFNRKGIWDKREIIDIDKKIGIVVSKNGNFDTNSFKIHYSKTGTHIVPYRKGGKQNEG